MVSNNNSMIEINAGREVFFNFLSRSFQVEVDDEYLEMVTALLPHIEKMSSQTEVVSLNTGGKLLNKFVNRLSGLNPVAKKALLLDLARDFAYLFLTGVKSVPTCESVYSSPEHLLKQGSYSDSLKIYNSIGFQAKADFKGSEDHIAIQFKFMAILANRFNKAIEAGDYEDASQTLDIQFKFYEEHLNKWIPKFCQLMFKVAEERNFYLAITHLTAGFLVLDYDVLQSEITPAFQLRQLEDQAQAGV